MARSIRSELIRQRALIATARRELPNPYEMAERLREHLRKAGVDRPQLFESSDVRIPVRAHDLRASFVTVSMSAGKSEAWITDRTGHKSSQMLYRYRRAARTHAELNLGTFVPLYRAIRELDRE